jgi:hypothetical protein
MQPQVSLSASEVLETRVDSVMILMTLEKWDN